MSREQNLEIDLIDSKQNEFMIYYDRVKFKLSGFARAITRNAENARDLVSDTVLAAYENFDKIKNKEAFSSYIFTIAVRLHRKRKSKMKNFEELDDMATDNLINHDPMPDISHDIKVLYDTLDKLPEKMKEAIILYEISGFTIEEIKEIQGGTISGVKSRLKRGREKLSELMNDRITHKMNKNYSTERSEFSKNNDKLMKIGI
ncbi:MAG: RNA polymerase sigma factor [Candidatus Kapabacteria bacterium]|nr:RNA polymerase sigma factor [Candidatus Kapabacteria bacterium]